MRIRTLLLNIVLMTTLASIAGVFVFGRSYMKNSEQREQSEASFTPGFDDDEIYHLTERTVVDFYEPIIEQFNKESQLVVSSVDASIVLNLEQKGVFDVGILNKTQKITYKGTGRFFVDMSELTRDDIAVDDENKTVTISVPHTKLLPIEIDPNRFESEDAKKGFLAFGDLKFTVEEYNNLETEVKTKIEKSINAKENRLKADENAIEEIMKIYEPIIKSLDENYDICVEFKTDYGSTI